MAEEGRQSDGRFAPGNPGGHGSAASGRARHLRKLLEDASTDERVLAVWQEVMACAEGGRTIQCPHCKKSVEVGGDMKAAELFFSRLLGKPVQAVNVGDSEGGSLVFQIVTAKAEPKP